MNGPKWRMQRRQVLDQTLDDELLYQQNPNCTLKNPFINEIFTQKNDYSIIDRKGSNIDILTREKKGYNIAIHVSKKGARKHFEPPKWYNIDKRVPQKGTILTTM